MGDVGANCEGFSSEKMKDLEPRITHERPRPKSPAPKPFSNLPKDTDPHGISASMQLVADLAKPIPRVFTSLSKEENYLLKRHYIAETFLKLHKKARRIRKKFRDKGEPS